MVSTTRIVHSLQAANLKIAVLVCVMLEFETKNYQCLCVELTNMLAASGSAPGQCKKFLVTDCI